MVETIQCSHGHRFPVNREKHQDRTYVMCPHRGCHEKVEIRSRRIPFSRRWARIKEQQRRKRLEAKEMSRRQPAEVPADRAISINTRRMMAILAYSRMIQKREEELRKKGEMAKNEG